jgi:large subunit ribosomal protein L28
MPGRQKITTRKPQFGQSRSKAFNTVKRKFKLNMQTKRVWVPELERFVRIKVSAKELRTIDKIGLNAWLKRNNIKLESLL